ncbi:MAG: DUF748 domain-containing protein [Deltaproteobacteria bacterium]|nr:DUF748 domain-containing protein [Deltaproteobacteria bacterium]MBI3386524.1 DUF748 domain-containing protein [Deltaproteobacteria bacterium]
MSPSLLLPHLYRWRRWLTVLAVVFIIRIALPAIVRRVAMSQASQALHAQVEIGDVDLALLRGGIALKDVTVRAALPNGSPEDVPNTAPPLIAWKRFAIEVRWLPLFRKTIQLREVVLESPRVALDRLADGGINLLALVPASSTPAPTPENTPESATPTAAPAAAASGWGFGLDRFVLRDGGVRFRDLKIKDSEPIDSSIDAVEVTGIAVSPGFYGEPAHLHLALALEQGSLTIDAHLTLSEAGVKFDTEVEAKNLPIQRARLYIPNVGWNALQGALDATLAYRFDTGTQNELRGAVTLRDVSVRVPNFDEPALAWQTLTVKVDPVDLSNHRVVVGAVDLVGLELPVRAQGSDSLPLLAGGPHAAPSNTAAPPPPPPADAPEAPWHWTVTALHLSDSHVHVLGAAAPLDVGVGVSASDLADDAERPAQVQLALSVGTGSLNVDGAARIAPLGFAGTVRITDLSLPELIATTGALPPDQLQSARLAADVTVEAGIAAANGSPLAARDLRVRGKLSLADLGATTPDPQRVTVGIHSIDLAITEVLAAALLPAASTDDANTIAGPLHAGGQLTVSDVKIASVGSQAFTLTLHSLELALAELVAPIAQPADLRTRGRLTLSDLRLVGADPKTFNVATRSLDLPITELIVPATEQNVPARPLRVALGDLRLTDPTVQLTRVPEGLVLPKFSGDAAAPATPPTPPESATPPRPFEVTLASFRLANGRIAVDDRAVKPFFNGGLAPLNISARDLRWPDPTVSDLRIDATSATEGKLSIFGALARDGAGWIEVNADHLLLLPFNPYAAHYSSYSIGDGAVSLTSKVSVGNGRYDADNWLTLHGLDVQGASGDSLFQQQFGIPLSFALALMRDPQGDIALGIPVTADAEGMQVGLGTVVRSALQSAIVGALTSPLKLVGGVFSDGKVATSAPPTIAFRPGRSALASEGEEQLTRLAGFVAGRPAIGVTLETAVTTADVRWLREQALRAEWGKQGLLSKLRGLPQRGTREIIQHALDARANDEPGELSPDDAATLDSWLAERPAIAPEELRALANGRLAYVEQALRELHGIDAQRITRHEPAADILDATPSVTVQIGTAGS